MSAGASNFPTEFSQPHQVYQANYLAALAMDHTTGLMDATMLSPDYFTRNPFMFKAKKKADPDTPNIREALSGPHREEFIEKMALEIQELEEHGTWSVIKRKDIKEVELPDGTKELPEVIPSTWAFKIKRFPSGMFCKLKARFCARGDCQLNMDDPIDTYAPVASWTSIRMLTVMSLQKGWKTKQIDFSNAFVQADLDRPVYVALPAMFNDTSGIDTKDLCLQLHKSLYGLKDAPKLWADWLSGALEDLGMTPSTHDPGIFYGKGMAIAVYVDDLLFYGPDEEEMEKLVTALQTRGFKLKREKGGDDKAYDFLGISVHESETEVKLTQFGLIKKFLATVGMTDCNAKATPCSKTPLATNKNGPRHNDKWEYASAVGQLMYLAGNAYPEIQFAVHQCARFTHCPRQSHSQAIKRIAHYLKGILDNKQGLTFTKTDYLDLNCYVDADFAGLWSYKDDQDPVCVKSRTGYVMTLGGCPIHWTSKLQQEISLSTTESEYIALAQAMRELLPMRRLYEELLEALNIEKGPVTIKSTIFEDNNGAISTATMPKMTPRTKHIATKYHFVKQYFGKNKLEDHPFELKKIDTKIQKADIFTKGLVADIFLHLRKILCGH